MMNLDLFEKVEVAQKKGGARPNKVFVGVKNQIGICTGLVRDLGWVGGDRVDLYKMGSTFALKKNPVGTLRLGSYGKTIRINSQQAYLNVKPFVVETDLDAWIEEGVLFFRGTPVAGVVRK